MREIESRLNGDSDSPELKAYGEGWKSIYNWRKLSLGMNSSAIERLLGVAHRVNGGYLKRHGKARATWYSK